MYGAESDFSLTYAGRERFSVNQDRVTSDVGSITSAAKDEQTKMGIGGL